MTYRRIVPISGREGINCCQDYFSFELPSVTLVRRTDKFLDKLKLCENSVINNVRRL